MSRGHGATSSTERKSCNHRIMIKTYDQSVNGVALLLLDVLPESNTSV